MSESNKGRVKALQADIEKNLKGKTVDLAQHLTDNPAWHFPASSARFSSGSDHQGLEQVLAIFSGDVSLFYKPESLAFDYRSYTAEADRVHSHFTLRGELANGKPYRNDYQSLFRLEGGLVAEVWEYFDSYTLFTAFDH